MKVVGGRRVFDLGEVVSAIGRRFEDVPSFWLEAEMRDLRPRRGQVFFRLADGEESIAASMNSIVFGRLASQPADGARVQAYGRVTFYRRRGELSLRVERLEETGEGLLRARIAELRGRLGADGVLDPARKRSLPMLPRKVGLVASADGSAWHDVVVNITARFPGAHIVAADAVVQGDAAPASIVEALGRIAAVDAVDVMIVARGGGSLEDLMAFNSELVCRAVASAPMPVVSAIGHEDDVTLCDEVADVRVSTPTKAAEAVVPDREALEFRLAAAEQTMRRALARRSSDSGAALARGVDALGHALRARGRRSGDLLSGLDERLRSGLARTAARSASDLARVEQGLGLRTRAHAAQAEREVARLEGMLTLLSPKRTLSRGYAIVRGADGHVLGTVDRIVPGAAVSVEMGDGSFSADVTGVER